MKKSLIFIFFLSVLFVPSKALSPEDTTSAFNQVLASFRTGSSKELARYFDASLSLNLNGQNGYYSKAQAEIILKDFFYKFPPKDFTIQHQGGNGSTSYYCVGTYLSGGNQFRVLVKGNPKQENFKIFSMEILQIGSYSAYKPKI